MLRLAEVSGNGKTLKLAEQPEHPVKT